jgi:hypothetical protein
MTSNNDLYPPSNPFPGNNQQPLSTGLNQFQIDANDSSFQPIEAGYVGSGAMDSAYQTNQQPGMQQQQQPQQPQQPKTWYQRMTSCFDLSVLQPSFDVDTEDVKERLWGCVRYANSPDYFLQGILNKEGKAADLYGPVWVCMTCILLFAVTSNTAKFLHASESLTDFEYDITHLTDALSVLSFYTFVIPFALFLALKCINVPLTLVDLISLYGYSLVPYMPITLVCLFPSVFLEWIFLLSATAVSTLMLLRNIAGPVIRTSMRWSGPVMLGIMVCNGIFCLVLKFCFYKHRYTGRSGKIATDDATDDGALTDDGGI